MIFAHVDLINGIAKDSHGMMMLADELQVDGVLTTRSHLITAAQKAGLLGIQRLFMLDSEALQTGLKMIQVSHPDAVELPPAHPPIYCEPASPKTAADHRWGVGGNP